MVDTIATAGAEVAKEAVKIDFVKIGGLIVGVFSAIAACTPTPKQGTLLARAYGIVDFLAINWWRAKDRPKV